MKRFDLYFETQGERSGLPVVFIPPFPFSLRSWDPQRKVLPPKYYGIFYDIRGLGKSPLGDGQYTMEMFVDDLESLLDHLNIKTAVLCGLSLGGYIALRFVEKFPGRLKGLVLCNTRSEADNNETKLARAQFIKLIKTEGLAAYAGKQVSLILSDQTKQNQPEILDSLKKMILAQDALAVCGGQIALLSRTDTTESLSRITCPTLIIHGDEDALIPLSQAQKMSQRISNSRIVVIPRTGHLANQENPEAFNRALLEFLEKL